MFVGSEHLKRTTNISDAQAPRADDFRKVMTHTAHDAVWDDGPEKAGGCSGLALSEPSTVPESPAGMSKELPAKLPHKKHCEEVETQTGSLGRKQGHRPGLQGWV